MQFRNSGISSRLVRLFSTLLFLSLLVPSLALAGDDDKSASSRALLSYLPADSQFAAQVDVEKLRKSKYFKRAYNMLEEQAKDDEKLAELISEDGFDIESDLSSVAIGLPVSRVSPNTGVNKGVFVMDGSFDEEKIRKLVKEEYDDLETREIGDMTAFRLDETEFGLPASNRLVITMGPESYRKKVWNLARKGGKSFEKTASDKNLLDGLETDRTLWMVNLITGSMRGPSSSAKSAAISVNLDSGLDLQVVSRVDDEAAAKEMVQRIGAMKKSAGENPMLSMFGAGPLVENLKVENNKTSVVATTSMTESELDYLVQKVQQIAASQSTLSIPSSSGGAGKPTDNDGSKQTSDD